MKTDCLNMSVLARAEQLARAADLEIAHGNRVARAELSVLGNDLQALLAFNGRGELAVAEKIGVSARRPSSDAAAQLIELGQAKSVGAVHDQRDRKSTRLNSSHQLISYAVFCLKKK